LSSRPFIVALVCLAVLMPARAQAQGETLVLLRTATDQGAYHYAEVIHQRGRVIPFDVGHFDHNHPKQYREFWIGGGGVPLEGAKGYMVAEGFINKALGEHAGGALYLQPFLIGNFRPVKMVVAEAVYLGYVPLNDAASVQHLLERAKLEYDAPRFKVGAGYSVYKAAEDPARHRPFVTATWKAGSLGNFECWLQRLPGGHATVQIRYARLFRS
jgi:hypothetical protein